jgi:hypothetical protein
MKTRNVFLLLILLLSACSSQSLPTPILMATQTESPVSTKTSAITPTLTATIMPSPTLTRVPPDPKNLSYKVFGDIPQFEIDSYLRGVAIMQGYLCNVYQLCEFKPITLLIGNTGRGCGSDDTVGGTRIYMHVQDCGLINPTELDLIGGTAGESAIAYTIQQQGCMTNSGGRLNLPATWFDGGGAWLREHALIWAGEIPPSWKSGLAPEEWAYRRYVRESPKWDVNQILYMDLGADNNRDNWWHRIVIGYVMFEYLDQHPEMIKVASQPGEPKLLLTRLCKAILKTGSLDEALKMVGVDRQNLYARLVEHIAAECATEDIVCDGEAEPSSISGQIIWSASYQYEDVSQYVLQICPLKDGECYENIPIQSDGTFFQLVRTGSFRISLNRIDDDTSIGWYSKNGMAIDQVCADLIYVGENKNVKISFYIAPTQCAK